jgi:hypothetical protein
MEDQIIESSKTPRNTAKQDYADRLFSALVSSLTKDLQRGLENFLVSNHIKRKEIFLKFLEDNGYSLDTARHLAIIERRTLRKQRTKARNEKIKTDRIAAREERRRMKAEREQKEGGVKEPIPEGMFIQFYPKPHESVPMYKGISVNFPDGTNLTLQECTAEGLSSLINVYNKRKEEATACSL